MCSKHFCASLILCFVLAAGCSVKEDRSPCGCQLRVAVFCPPGPQPVRLRIPGFPALDMAHDTVLVLAVFSPETVLEACSGAFPEPDGSFRIAEGAEAPPLYLYSGRVDTGGEAAEVEVRLRKEYCQLRLRFRAPPGYGPPFGLRLKGEVAGCKQSGEPLPGIFFVETAPDAEGLAEVRLPRQRDGSLCLQLVYRDAVLRSFALGEYILEAGYDWEAASLKDMEVEIDIGLTSLTLSIIGEPQTERKDILV